MANEPLAWSGYDLDSMVEAFSRLVEAHVSRTQPFHDPIASDAQLALRILRGFVPQMNRMALHDARTEAGGLREAVDSIVRCRYPVSTDIRPSGHDWDLPRLDEVVDALVARREG